MFRAHHRRHLFKWHLIKRNNGIRHYCNNRRDNYFAWLFSRNTPAINIPSGLTESNGTLTWQPAAVGSLTLSISASGVPASQNTILPVITAASYQRQANVQFTTYVDALNNMIGVTTGQYVLVTLPR